MIQDACGDNRQSDVSPKIVGEWSLAFNNQGDNFLPMTGGHAASYSKWFSPQQRQYESLNGWIFWTWKTDENLPNVEQWNYQSKLTSLRSRVITNCIFSIQKTNAGIEAVDSGIIDKDLNAQYNQNPC